MEDMKNFPLERNIWIFDLDNTLYPVTNALFSQIGDRMRTFIATHYDLSLDAAEILKKKYYYQFGATLRGLMTFHDLDPQPFLDYIHDIDYSVLTPDRRLDRALDILPGRKIIFTNGTYAHAVNTLDCLGITRHFDGIFDICDAAYIPKPDPEPYDRLIRDRSIDPHRAIMIEDTCVNLKVASRQGMLTVWVRPTPSLDAFYPPSGSSRPGALDDGSLPAYVDYVTTDLSAWLESVVA